MKTQRILNESFEKLGTNNFLSNLMKFYSFLKQFEKIYVYMCLSVHDSSMF